MIVRLSACVRVRQREGFASLVAPSRCRLLQAFWTRIPPLDSAGSVACYHAACAIDRHHRVPVPPCPLVHRESQLPPVLQAASYGCVDRRAPAAPELLCRAVGRRHPQPRAVAGPIPLLLRYCHDGGAKGGTSVGKRDRFQGPGWRPGCGGRPVATAGGHGTFPGVTCRLKRATSLCRGVGGASAS